MASKAVRREGASGTTVAIDPETGTIQIEALRLPTPPLAGFANRAAVVESEGFLECVLWEQTGQPVARFYMGGHDFVHSIWPMSAPLLEAFRESKDTSQLTPASLSNAPDKRPEGAAALVNLLGLARQGEHGILECFYISPKGIHLLRTGKRKDVEISGLFSVVVPSLLMYGLLTHFETLVPKLQKSLQHWTVK